MMVEPGSSHEFLDRMVRLHACETKIQTLKVETQACVVDPHQLEDGGLQVIYVNWVFGDVKTQSTFISVMPGRMPPPASHMVKA